MLGKASEIKTKRVFEVIDTNHQRHYIDEMINNELSQLPPESEVLSIQYQATGDNRNDWHYALIIYREAKQ